MKKRMLYWYEGVLSALFTLLGFSSCSGISSGPTVEYGCPSVEFQVKGSVTDASTGNPVEGVQARLAEVFTDEETTTAIGIDSVLTNKDGRFELPLQNDMTIDGPRLALILEDPAANAVDGSSARDGGIIYASDTLLLQDMERRQVKEGDGKWFKGGFEMDVNHSMKRQYKRGK